MAGSNAGYLVKQGLHAAGNGDYTTAAKLFKKACDGKSTDGCYNLGLLYDKGYGIKLNYSKAAKYYKKACDDGIAEGCINLGVLYYNGQGVSMNKFKAYKYLMKAAKHVNQDAQHDMVILCRQSPWACK